MKIAEMLGLDDEMSSALRGREEEWKNVEYNLKVYFSEMEFNTRAWKAAHKKLFFRGEVDFNGKITPYYSYSGEEPFGFCLPLFLIWYFGHLGDGFIGKVVDFYSDELNRASVISKSREMVMHAARTYPDSGWDDDYGVFGAMTGKIISTLWGRLGEKLTFDKFGLSSSRRAFYPGRIMGLYFNSVLTDLRMYRHQPGVGHFFREYAIWASMQGDNIRSKGDVIFVLSLINKELLKLGKKGVESKSEASSQAMSELQQDLEENVWPDWIARVIFDGVA